MLYLLAELEPQKTCDKTNPIHECVELEVDPRAPEKSSALLPSTSGYHIPGDRPLLVFGNFQVGRRSLLLNLQVSFAKKLPKTN